MRKFVANCAPNLCKIAGFSFRATHEGCAKLSQICGNSESQFPTILCVQMPLFQCPLLENFLYRKKDPLQLQHGNVHDRSWQPVSNSWSTSRQPDLVRSLGRRKTARNCQSKILYTELLKNWSTLDQFLAWGVFKRPLTLILLQKDRDTNGRRIMMQIGGVYTTF